MLRDTALLKNMAEVDRLQAAIHELRGDALRGAAKEKGVAGASVHSASALAATEVEETIESIGRRVVTTSSPDSIS